MIERLILPYGLAQIVIIVLMSVFWVYQERQKDATFVDVVWAVLTGACGILWYIYLGASHWLGSLGLTLLLIWSGRLALHLFKDRVGKSVEDKRYAKLREQWGAKASVQFFFVFQINGVLALMLSLSIVPLVLSEEPNVYVVLTGVLVWLASVFGELLADHQLKRFKSNPKNSGKTCREGLWRYSRHPNYFFEWLHWTSYLFLGFASELWWLGLIAPIVMFLFLNFVTGIPIAERLSLQSRSDYKEYQRETNAFFPWFPRS